MKGLFIPEITAEMFRNGCLESIETLMAEGEIYDIDYSLEQEPCEDCISREQLVRELNAQMAVDAITKEVAIDMLEHLPPVTLKPKTDVLDKIRAEIKEVQTYKMFEGEDTVYVERKDVLAIINKYRTEKE